MYRLLFVLVTVALVADAKKLASYIKPCKKDDPDLNGCAKRHGLEAIPQLLKGDREYKNPSLLPLHLPQVAIDSGSNLKLKLKDIVLSGLENIDLRDIDISLEKKEFSVVAAFPKINIKSQYEMDGQVLVLPLKGNGLADLTFDDVVVNVLLKYKLIKKDDGKEYVDPDFDSEIKYTLKNAHYQFDNLFNGDKVLGDQTNAFLNEHSVEVAQDLGEPISQTIGAVVKNIVQLIISVVPYDEIFI